MLNQLQSGLTAGLGRFISSIVAFAKHLGNRLLLHDFLALQDREASDHRGMEQIRFSTWSPRRSKIGDHSDFRGAAFYSTIATVQCDSLVLFRSGGIA